MSRYSNPIYWRHRGAKLMWIAALSMDHGHAIAAAVYLHELLRKNPSVRITIKRGKQP